MTFRERIADWISGGKLSEAVEQRAIAELAAGHARGFSRFLEAHLDRIAAEERPTSNATVKRMARIARIGGGHAIQCVGKVGYYWECE